MHAARFDPRELIDRLGGDATLATEAAAIFITEAPGLLARVQESVGLDSAEQLSSTAHSLKGAASNFCREGATATAAQLEQIGREHRLADAPALLSRLESEMADLVSALQAFAQVSPES